MLNLFRKNEGQALIMLLVFTVVAITVTTTATIIIINVTRATSVVESRMIAIEAADSGLENAVLRTLRDPTYTGETLPVGEATVLITVSGTDPIVITSQSQFGNFSQTARSSLTYNDNRLVISDWEYIY